MKANLRHWDTVEELSAPQLIRLTLGIDPHSRVALSPDDEAKEKLLQEHLYDAYLAAGGWVFVIVQVYAKDPELLAAAKKRQSWSYIPADGRLPSVDLPSFVVNKAGRIGLLPSTTLGRALETAMDEGCPSDTLEYVQVLAYDLPEFADFSRSAIRDWLAYIGWKSEYPFLESTLGSPQQRVSRSIGQATAALAWPWGSYDTKMLRLLPLVYEEHWKGYDPSRPETAPKNDVVTDWLTRTHGTPTRVAEVIAQMFRADGLPSGRRLKKN